MVQIIKDSICSAASNGRVTLQIPEFVLFFEHPSLETIPDNWVCRLKQGYKKLESMPAKPSTGKENGFLFLTSVGWNANKSKIKKTFKSSLRSQSLSISEIDKLWQDFEEHASEHFNSLRGSIRAETMEARGKLQAARARKSKRSEQYWKQKLFELRSFVV